MTIYYDSLDDDVETRHALSLRHHNGSTIQRLTIYSPQFFQQPISFRQWIG